MLPSSGAYNIACAFFKFSASLIHTLALVTNLFPLVQFSADVDFPSDAQKIQKIKLLVDNGFADRVLVSQDIHTKHRMVRPYYSVDCIITYISKLYC